MVETASAENPACVRRKRRDLQRQKPENQSGFGLLPALPHEAADYGYQHTKQYFRVRTTIRTAIQQFNPYAFVVL